MFATSITNTTATSHTSFMANSISIDKENLSLSVAIVLAVFIIATIAGNSLVCFVFYRQRWLRKPSYCPIISLAVADLLCGALAMPAYIAKKYVKGGWQERVVCDVFRFTYFFTMYASVLSLAVISIERFMAVKMPMKHRTWLTNRKITAALVFSWLDAAVVSALPFVWRNNRRELCTYAPTDTWSTMVIVTNVFFPFLIMLFCQVYTVSFAVNYTRRRHKLEERPRTHGCQTPTKPGTMPLNRERDITCTLAVVVGIFVLCWGPSSFYYFIRNVCPKCYRPSFKQVKPIFNAIVKLMTFANSCLNPLIYCWLNQSLRKAFRQSFLRKSEARRRRFHKFSRLTATSMAVCASSVNRYHSDVKSSSTLQAQFKNTDSSVTTV